MPSKFHENFDRPDLPLPPDRSTGFVFVAIALVVAYFYRDTRMVWAVALAMAIALLIASVFRPLLLRPLNIAWMRFALILSKVVNPVVMAILFVVAIVPAGLLMQLRYDPLRRKRLSDARSYWIEREGIQTSSMTNQF